MFFCFVDESGTPPKPEQRGRPPYFIIAGVFVPVSQWHGIAKELQQLKDRCDLRIRGEIKWRYFGPQNNDPKNSVSHLSTERKDAFRHLFFQILKKRNSIKAVVTVAKIDICYRQPYINNEHDLYGYTYKPVSERFQYHLQDMSRSTGAEQLGIIVADHRGRNDDQRIRQEHQKLLHSASSYISSYANLAESLFLTPSHHSVGIQFADMIAGAVGRHFNSNDRTWFEVAKPILRAKPDGSVDGYGLVKMPNTW